MKILSSMLLVCLGLATNFVAPLALTIDARATVAVQGSVETLVADGRRLLESGKPAEAQAQFEQAEKLDNGSLRTRQWTLRSWIAQGRINDALDQIDKLSNAGNKGPAIDYLYGMAFATKAKNYMQDGRLGNEIDMSFTDAVGFLASAVKAEPELYKDAYLLLAEAAWFKQQLDVARSAAEKACTVRPRDPEAAWMLGRIAFSQYVAASDDPAKKADADSAWEAARKSYARMIELLIADGSPESKLRSADAHVELGKLYSFQKKSADAAREYAAAIGTNPAAVDYGQIRSELTPDDNVKALEDGDKLFVAASGTSNADAPTLWWLGFARYQKKEYAPAEEAFAKSVAKMPAYTNAWFYIAMSRYYRQDYDGTIEALKKHKDASPSDLVASLVGNQDENLRILDYLISLVVPKGRNLDAAFLSEVETMVVPQNAGYWNNLGLFLRDEGEGIQRSHAKPSAEEKAKMMGLFERALVAYQHALDLSPDDPNYLNDLAVVLDYNLDRDLDKARALYQKAFERAEAELARTDLTSEVRDLRTTARRDSKNNLERLDKKIEERKKGGEKKPGDKG